MGPTCLRVQTIPSKLTNCICSGHRIPTSSARTLLSQSVIQTFAKASVRSPPGCIVVKSAVYYDNGLLHRIAPPGFKSGLVPDVCSVNGVDHCCGRPEAEQF